MLQSRRAGYSLIEAVVASAITVTAMSMAVAGFSFMLRGDRLVTQQTELDMDARTLLERIRNDLWMTGRPEILLYPPDSNTYTAISFPLLSSGGEPLLDADGRIQWDSTVIYHLYEDGDVFEVRRTVFDSWISNDATRRQQLEDVVVYGEGDGSSSTQTLIENLVDWKINITANRFDAYAPAAAPEKISLGSARIKPGANEITFRAVGKNRAGRGSARYLGIDQLYVTPSGLPLEGEWMAVASSSGVTPSDQNMVLDETWNGNARLWFPATADGNEFTLAFTNDSFDMRNFSATADNMNSVVRFNHTIGGVNTFGLRLDGSGVVWRASEQAGSLSSTNLSAIAGTSTSVNVRVVLRGYELSSNGTNVWLTFTNVFGSNINLENVKIGMAEPGDPSQMVGSGESVTLNALSDGSYVSDPVAMSIFRTNDYLVSFDLTSVGDGPVSVWTDDRNPTNSIVNGARRQEAFVLSSVRAGHAPLGTYISEIIDTALENPRFAPITKTKDSSSSSSSVSFRFRGSDSYAAVEGQAWSSSVSDGLRYVQIEATLRPDAQSGSNTKSPELYDFNLPWTGDERYVALSGRFSTGPDHGIYEVEVNGEPILRGVTVDLTVYKDVNMLLGEPKRLTAKAFAEVVPKNVEAATP